MDFHAEFFPPAFLKKIKHQDKLMLVGSCFTEQIGNKLGRYKFDMLQNPNGILFNPASISAAVRSYVDKKMYGDNDLFYYNELWNSWDHHSRFSKMDKQDVVDDINQSQIAANHFLKNADWLMITLGSAFVYEAKAFNDFTSAIEVGEVVANCHKVPADKFNRRMLAVEEIVKQLAEMIASVKAFNPAINFIFTISPVRHLREGFIENNRSKAALIQAVHALTNNEYIYYFPAYELVIDDLRDYRFYAEDMVHPNYAATNYVWDKFIETAIDESSRQLMKEIAVIVAAKTHKPFNPASEQHKKFLQINLDKVQKLQEQFPYINFEEEILYFKR